VIRRIAALVKKEFRQILRDPGTLGVLLVVPLFLLVMFGYAINLDTKNIALGVLDQDKSRMSRSYIDSFVHTEYFRYRYSLSDRGQIDSLMDRGEILVALVIPRGFQKSLIRGEETEVQAIVDGSNGNSASTALGYVQAVSSEYSAKLAAVRLTRAGRQVLLSPLEVRPRVLFNPELNSADFLVPGLIVLILGMIAVISTSLAVVREKELGTMEQILVSPLRPVELIVGKTVPYIVTATISTVMAIALGYLLFGVAVRGSILMLALMSFLFLLCSLGMGLFISTISDSQQVAFTISVLITMLPSFVLSGFVFPISNMPIPIQAVTYLMPTRYYLAALRGIMVKGAGFSSYAGEAAGLAIFAAITLAGSAYRLRRAGRGT
jgi:ABC-2 type transport system permease protein